MATNGVVHVFLQEGSVSFTNAVTEANSNPSMLYPSNSALISDNKKIAELAFASDAFMGVSRVTGNGGVSRAAFYNTIGTPALSATDHVTDDYAIYPVVRDWVFEPANKADTIRYNDKKLLGGTSRRLLTHVETCDYFVTKPIQARANLVAQRRPEDCASYRRHHRAAIHGALLARPAGRCDHAGRRGPVERQRNDRRSGRGGRRTCRRSRILLFSKFIRGNGAFPNLTLLIGDLNITGTAVDHIYGGTRQTSEEGWCHIVAPASATLTLIDNSNALATALGGSDHAPVVCDVTF